jgi:hypothetical protein
LLSIQRDIHALAQTIQHRLLTRQAQLRVLLLQTMMKLGKATGTVGEEVVHRHFKRCWPFWI